MSGRAIWTIFSILQCGVSAEVRIRCFALQQPPAFMHLYVQITHKKTPVIPVAVSCATDPNCVFFSTGKMKVWSTVDQTWAITGRQVPSVKPNRIQKIAGQSEEKPWRICGIWKKKQVTCDPAINSLPRIECVCQSVIQRYGNIYKTMIQLSQTMEDLSKIIIEGTFSSKVIITLKNSKLGRNRPFLIHLQPHLMTQWRGNQYREINYCPSKKTLIQGKPFIISLSVSKKAVRITFNNTCYFHYSLSDKVYLTGVDQIMVRSPKDAVLSTEVCDAKKFLLHGCVYQNIESKTRMTINLPLTPKGHFSIAAKVDFTHYGEKLIWLLKSAARRQQTIQIVLVPEALTIWYKHSSLIKRQKLHLGNEFLFSINAYRNHLQYSLNNGLTRRCKMKYPGLFNNVDKIRIINPIVLKEMYIQ